MSDRDAFLDELMENGVANADNHDLSQREVRELVEMGWITPIGGGEFLPGNMLDLHLGRGLQFDIRDGNE